MRTRRSFSLKSTVLLIWLLILLVLLTALNRFIPYWKGRRECVRDGVIFADKDVGGLSPAEVRAVIEQVASIRQIAPVNTTLDTVNNGVIPGLNGLTIDVEKTLEQIMEAQKGEKISPVYRQVEPEITLDAYPELPIYRGNPLKKQVAFLINVAWGNEYLEDLLAVLKENKAEATFFLVGRWVRDNTAEARLIAESGFEIANHGYSDALSMQEASLETAREDIRRAADIIEEICGKRPIYFSPHRGELSPAVLKAAALENNHTVMWTVDTVDWMLPGVEVMVEKILTQAEGGSLILMHPTEQTADFLRQVIPGIRAKGLEPVSLSTLLSPMRSLGE
ncbi:MAG: polysaccharide deacetylase family protein [Firmicutes bacterium]|nr:polysaccharide deacetylase family protein [Bacillota bacterium]